MNILLTLHNGNLKQQFFPTKIMSELRALGNVRENPHSSVCTQDELKVMLHQVEICIVMAWGGAPKFTKEVLNQAKDLKLIVTPGGSVASFITENVYERGIQVSSANRLMARYVAEGTLAYMQTAMRDIVHRHTELKQGIWNTDPCRSLIGARIGLIGLGTVGRFLLDLLQPFDVIVKLYDPYLSPEVLQPYANVSLCSLEEALIDQDIVSIHASKTEETYHLLNKDRLALLKDGTLLVNTARGALIDEKALIAELKTGRIRAVLDVFEEEPLPLSSELRRLENVILMPHVAGMVALDKLTATMIEEIQRFKNGKELLYRIPIEQFRHMSR